MKSIYFIERLKILKLRSDLSNLQAFCDFSKEYRVLSDYIFSIKRNIRIIWFKKFEFIPSVNVS